MDISGNYLSSRRFYLGINKIVKNLLNIVANCADEKHLLPEQVPINLNYPEKYNYCEIKWDKIAKPLLWSRSLYIILYY